MDSHTQDTAKREGAVSRQSMRAFLSMLADAGDLVSIPEAINLDYDVAACLAETDAGPALQFQNVKGPVVAALPRPGP